MAWRWFQHRSRSRQVRDVTIRIRSSFFTSFSRKTSIDTFSSSNIHNIVERLLCLRNIGLTRSHHNRHHKASLHTSSVVTHGVTSQRKVTVARGATSHDKTSQLSYKKRHLRKVKLKILHILNIAF